MEEFDLDRENLVYSWKWNDAKILDFKRSGVWYEHGDNYHCKDQQAITFKHNNGEIWLRDTYWSSEPFLITPEKLKNIDLIFKYDLNDFNEINYYEYTRKSNEYEPSDLLFLRCQAGYSNRYFIKKDARVSLSHKILKVQEELDRKQSDLASIERQIVYLIRELDTLKLQNTKGEN